MPDGWLNGLGKTGRVGRLYGMWAFYRKGRKDEGFTDDSTIA
jgi:hypothetical protein